MTDENLPVFGGDSTVSVMKSLPGGGRTVQLWRLRIYGPPDSSSHHATVECLYGDVNVVSNVSYPHDDMDMIIREEGLGGWRNVPDDVQDELLKLVPDGVEILDGDGGEYVVGEGSE